MRKRWILAVMLLAFAVPGLAQTCTIPDDGMRISQDTVFCQGTHTLPRGITLAAGAGLDCGGSTLQGIGQNTGIFVEGENTFLQNCFVDNYDIGIDAQSINNFVVSFVTFSNVRLQQQRSAGEDITLPITPVAEVEPIIPEPVLAEPVVQPEPNLSIQIWEVANIQSEALLANAMSFEHGTDNVPEAELAKRIAFLKDTLHNVRIEREFIYRNGETIVTIRVIPDSGFFRRVIYENITLYDYIPKCFAQLVDDVVFDQPGDTLNPDPLLRKVIRKEETDKGVASWTYRRPIKVSKECEELFRIIGFAEGLKVKTLTNVLTDEGVFAVFATFPMESIVMFVLAGLVFFAGILFKRSISEDR